ncbi:MAG: response regulator [Chloroflexota bacterium]
MATRKKPITVMIVDDHSTTTSLLETLLELDGFKVIVARRGADVMPKLGESIPDVMMIDFHLNDVEGVDIIREIRAHADYKHIPIVMASGMDKSDVALEAGANEFLLKPFEPADLPILFNRLISG